MPSRNPRIRAGLSATDRWRCGPHEGFRGLFTDRRRRTRGIHFLGPGDRKEQCIGLFAGLTIGRELCFDIALQGGRQLAERGTAVEARERQIDEKILRALGSDLSPGFGAGRALDQAHVPQAVISLT
jgi:hypothetical protein